jgi:parallel beta-helix repeat protein
LKKTVFEIMIIVAVSVGMLTTAFNIQSVKAASGSICIMPDGSISPSTANITTSDNVTYIFTGNNYLPIVVNRSNIIINGRGHRLQASGGKGFSLSSVSNVTIDNTTITNSSYGIFLYSSSGNVLSGNKITTNSRYGVELDYFSDNNVLSGNNVTSNGEVGIELYSSSGNALSDNNIANGKIGIYLVSSSGNVLSGNNVTANFWYGILLGYSSGNVLSGNVMASNTYGNFGVLGTALSDFVNHVDTSNLVDGKPVYYLVNQSNIVISPQTCSKGAGYLGLVNCANATVQSLTLTKNFQGLLLANTTNSKITDNSITTKGLDGVDLYFSSGNLLSGNNITANSIGMYVYYSSGNRIFHNDFLNNTQQAYVSSSTNEWDDGYPSGGNYWSNYVGIDEKSGPFQNLTGSDGIGDTPYIIDASNTDNYPLMNPWTGHDPAIVGVTLSKTVVGQGYSLNATITVANFGDYTETFNTILYANTTAIATQTLTLASGNSIIITFTWNTVGFVYGSYIISANITPAIGETNNRIGPFTYGTVQVTIPGDLNGDGVVNAVDFHILAQNWLRTVPPAPANVDIGGYGFVGPRDFHILAMHWLE